MNNGPKDAKENPGAAFDREIEWLLRDVPESDGGNESELPEAWAQQEEAAARGREAAAEDARRLEEAEERAEQEREEARED